VAGGRSVTVAARNVGGSILFAPGVGGLSPGSASFTVHHDQGVGSLLAAGRRDFLEGLPLHVLAVFGVPTNRLPDLGNGIRLGFGGGQIVLSFENRGVLLHVRKLHVLQLERHAILVECPDHHGRDLIVKPVIIRSDVFIGWISGENHPNIVADFHLREPLVDILNADPADPVVVQIGTGVTSVKMP